LISSSWVTVPLWLGGFVALILTRMRLGDIRREARAQLRFALNVRAML
jgi:hypothetical protein